MKVNKRFGRYVILPLFYLIFMSVPIYSGLNIPSRLEVDTSDKPQFSADNNGLTSPTNLNQSADTKINRAYIDYLYSLLSVRKRNLPTAVNYLEKARLSDPKSKFLTRELARIYLVAGKTAQALEIALKLRETYPDEVDTLLLLGEIYLFRSEVEKASEIYQEVLQLQPENEEATRFLADILFDRDPERAVTFYEKYADLVPTEEVLHSLVSLYWKLKRYEDALSLAERIINLAPDSNHAFLAHFRRGQIYREMKESDRALTEFRLALKIDTKSWWLWMETGVLSYLTKDYRFAEECFRHTIALAPDNSEAYYFLSLISEERKDWLSAIRYLNKVIEKEKNVPHHYVHLSYLYSRQGNRDKVVNLLTRAVELDPNNPEIYFFLGLAYEDHKAYVRAQKLFARAVTLKPDYVDAYYHLGIVYHQQGKFKDAVPYLEKAITLDVNFAPAYNYLGYSYADQNIELNKAKRLIEKAVELDPQNGAYLDSLGWVYYRLGEFKQAELYLSQANKLLKDSIILDHLGDIYLTLKQYSLAEDYWQECLRLDKRNNTVKTKLNRIHKHILPSQRRLKRVKFYEGNQKQIFTMSGLVTLKIVTDKTVIQQGVIVYYRQPENVRLDFLGSFGIPRTVVLFGKDGGMHLQPRNFNDINLREEETFLIAEILCNWLNGRILPIIVPEIDKRNELGKNTRLTVTGNTVSWDKDKNLLLKCTFSSDRLPLSGLKEQVNLTFTGYKKVEGIWFPQKIHITFPARKFNWEFYLHTMEFNQRIEDKVFTLTVPDK